MFAIIRHGERADHAGGEEWAKNEVKFDPHLTPLGALQAQAAGQRVAKIVKSAIDDGLLATPKPKILVLSSPFLRCIMTARNIIKGLQDEYEIVDNAIHVQYGLAEYIEAAFDATVLEDLHFAKGDKEKLSKYVDYEVKKGYIDETDFELLPKYSEDWPGYHKRFLYFVDRFRKLHEEKLEKEGIVTLAVSHGAAIQCSMEIWDTYDAAVGFPYCGINHLHFVKGEEKPKILLKQDGEHIKGVVLP